jgi:exosortase A-associated hydrolase 2
MLETRQTRSIEPVFIAGSAGRLFAVHYRPASASGRDAILYVPPFAEEMNRSRRMAALQARALAAQGFGVLTLDLFGTGDSDGDFAEARWEHWLADIAAASDWLVGQGWHRITLWGLRLGALLAVAAASRQPDRFQRLLLWQPVADGKTMLTQFLRVRVATAMAEGRQETTDALRAELASGRSLEVGGYEVAPDLARALDAARLDKLPLRSGLRVDWLELAGAASEPVSPVALRHCAAWQLAGIAAAATVVAGPPFWTLQEVTLAPDLLVATRDVLAGAPAV